MATIGKLAVEITAETAGLARGLSDAGKQTDDFQNRLGSLTSKLKILGPAAIAAGGAFAIGMVKSVADTADALGDLSERTGIAVEDLSRLQYVAQMSGSSAEQMNSAIIKLSKGMADGNAVFDALGVSVKNADGSLRSQIDVLGEVADRFTQYEDGTAKTALAMELFGKSGAEMIGVLNAGSAGIKALADESDRLGNTLSAETARAAGEFNDNIDRMTTLLGGMARTIAGPVIEAMADFTSSMFDAWKQGDTLFGMLEAGFKRLAQADTIEAARAKVNELEESMHRMRASPMFDEASMGAMTLARNLDEARARLAELLSEQQKSNAPAPSGGGRIAAPVVDRGGEKVQPSQLIEQLDALDQMILDKMSERNTVYVEQLELRLKALQESILSEEEIAALKHEKEMETLIAAYDEKLLTEQEYMLLTQDLEMKHMDELARIREAGLKRMGDMTKQSWQQQAQTVAQQLQNMTAAAANGSKAMFNINKAASIANALLSARESVTNAYRFGTRVGGPAVGAAFAAVAAAATASQIAALKSTSFSTGASAAGSVSAGGGSIAPSESAAATLPNTQAASGASRGQLVTIQLQGETFGREAVRNLISEINEAISDGAVLRLA